MAQIIENVPPTDYLKEGNKIMKDAFQLLAQIKQTDHSVLARSPRLRKNISGGRKSKTNSPEPENTETALLLKLERKFINLEKRFLQVSDQDY
jgi:hypothetical protein